MSRATLALVQLCDSLFPLGAFAHSDGLEAAVASGRVESAGDFRSWLHATLAAAADADVPAVRGAVAALDTGSMDALVQLDDEVWALRSSATGRDASRAMGARLLATWQRIRPGPTVSSVLALDRMFTLPVAFGIVCAASGATRVEAIESYLYSRLAATVSAGMRLIALGQHEAHALLAEALDRVPPLAASLDRSEAPPRSFVPLLDIAAMSHQYVHSRLFRS
ncbi:MAG: urease accessory protein UreF [Vicinamibacterales bacterium]